LNTFKTKAANSFSENLVGILITVKHELEYLRLLLESHCN